MRKIILLLIVVFLSLDTLKAQVSMSCYHREYCNYSNYTQSYTRCDGYDEPSLFVMNSNETMFTHTTESIKSTYYVKEKAYDEDTEMFIYYVTSDVGNEYIYSFDLPNKEIKALGEDNDGSVFLIRFYVKSFF
ncbi:MAG: hypothetical protein ACPG5B_17240 [Chitinophagales bacterium]